MKRSRKNGIIYGLLMLVSILLLLSLFRFGEDVVRRFGLDFFYPYLSLRNVVEHSLSDLSLMKLSRRELAEKLETLRAQNRMLSAQSAAAVELVRQNNELRQMLKLPRMTGWNFCAAQILQRDPLFWYQHFSINRGSANGIRSGSAVFTVTNQGMPILVGVVSDCTKHASQVTTVYSGKFRLSGVLMRGGVSGMCNADDAVMPEGYLKLCFLPVEGDFTVGDVVTTTGFEPDVPPGLKIGNIVSIERRQSAFSEELYSSAMIRAAADLNMIRFVIVAAKMPSAEAGR